MNAARNQKKETRSIWSLLAFVFTIIFGIHVMLIPVWFGARALMLFERGQSFPVPIWFMASGAMSLLVAIALGFVPRRGSRE